jgi:branched-chain amino acid transport system substrate-binding protein
MKLRSTAAAAAAGVAALALLLTGCSTTGPSSGTTSHLKGTISIGVLLPLTGPQAELGASFKAGVEAAAAYLNQHENGIMGKEIKLDTFDTGYVPTQAAAGAKKLIQDGVVAIDAEGVSGDMLAVQSALGDDGVPIVTGAQTDSVYTAGKWAYNISETTSMSAKLYIDYLQDNLHISKIGILYEAGAYGQGQTDQLVAALKAENRAPVGVESFASGSTDVTAQLRKLKDAGAKAVIFGTYGPGLVAAINSFGSLNWNVPALGSSGTLEASVVQTAQAAGVKTLYAAQVPDSMMVAKAGDKPSAAAAAYIAALKAAGGKENQSIDAALMWDGLVVLKGAIEKAKSTDPDKIAAALESGTKFPALRSSYSYSASDHRGQHDLTDIGFANVAEPCTGGICVAAPGIFTK